MQSNNSHNKNQGNINLKPFEILFEKYTASHQNKINLIINCIAIPIMVFGILGFTWAIPFPVFSFLGQYIGYINWASIIIALSIYYYLKLSPHVGFICFALIMLSLTAQLIGQKIEGKPYSLANIIKFQFYGSIWLISLVLRKYSIKF